jgi:hypothetical protein
VAAATPETLAGAAVALMLAVTAGGKEAMAVIPAVAVMVARQIEQENKQPEMQQKLPMQEWQRSRLPATKRPANKQPESNRPEKPEMPKWQRSKPHGSRLHEMRKPSLIEQAQQQKPTELPQNKPKQPQA